MTETERQVMRVVDLYPGSAASEIARCAHLQRTNVSTALRGVEEKGMIARAGSGGRGVAVNATERAGQNLQTLRDAWVEELAPVLAGDLGAVRRCNELLARLERRLTEDDRPARGREA